MTLHLHPVLLMWRVSSDATFGCISSSGMQMMEVNFLTGEFKSKTKVIWGFTEDTPTP